MRIGNREVNVPGASFMWVIAVVVLVWVLYLLLEVARHVQAWPFA